ncbi:unnamed protein product [Durusdinium trenchii]|uniref:Uncharacterized protein n=1 Tax=Durusdinium trenchii TaxID=1381693 RepID=A0ABP0HUP8_9DINO
MPAVGVNMEAARPWFMELNERVKRRQHAEESEKAERVPRDRKPQQETSGGGEPLALMDQASAQSGRNYCVMTERGKETWEAFQATVGPAQKWDSRLVLGPEPQVAAEAIRRALGLAV